MSVRVTAFAWVPPVAQGLVRDLRVRWALEEVGLTYEEQLLRLGENTSADHIRRQPFGQVPTFEQDGLILFESGAIVLHIAECCERLLPSERKRRARIQAWMFAALNTIEPPVMFLNQLQQMEVSEARALLQPVTAVVRRRLHGLSDRLESRDYLEDEFSAADLLMTTVLRILRTTDLVRGVPALHAFQSRCEARPAFQRALTSQMTAFRNHEPSPARVTSD